jgi:3',5'-cyclic AMP phosphodiesterase CpdA
VLTAIAMPEASARAQLEIPSKPAAPSTISPVPLKQERDVSSEAGQIRILVVGDPGVRDGGWHGDSDEARLAVAARSREACTEKQCDLVLILGDNLYDKGIRKDKRDEDSSALAGIVESFLASPDIPVYLVMGNHDWSPRIARHSTVDRQLEWIGETTEPDVRGNAHFFNFRAGPVEIWALDTTPLVRRSSASRDPNLSSWLDGIATSKASWKIVAAHHPMRSNGEHGNPGRYREPPIPFSVWSGRGFRRLLDDKVEGAADLYVAGHEHNLQFLSEVGPTKGSGTAAAVMGSASKCTGPGKRSFNPGMELEAYNFGFAIIDATHARLEISFHIATAKGWNTWSAWRSRSGDWDFSDADPPGSYRACDGDDSCCPSPD